MNNYTVKCLGASVLGARVLFAVLFYAIKSVMSQKGEKAQIMIPFSS